MKKITKEKKISNILSINTNYIIYFPLFNTNNFLFKCVVNYLKKIILLNFVLKI